MCIELQFPGRKILLPQPSQQPLGILFRVEKARGQVVIVAVNTLIHYEDPVLGTCGFTAAAAVVRMLAPLESLAQRF